jgi:hypothetical protein
MEGNIVMLERPSSDCGESHESVEGPITALESDPFSLATAEPRGE